jgi:hypothetical protein
MKYYYYIRVILLASIAFAFWSIVKVLESVLVDLNEIIDFLSTGAWG